MSFDIGSMISGAVTGFLETGNPIAAGAIGVLDGLTGNSGGAGGMGAMGVDTMLAGSGSSSLMDFAELAAVFA